MIAPVVERVREGAVLVDVRYYLDGRPGRGGYDAGHLPGAVYVEMDDVLAAPGSVIEGRHPLPDPAVFAAGMSSPASAPDQTPSSPYWLLELSSHPGGSNLNEFEPTICAVA